MLLLLQITDVQTNPITNEFIRNLNGLILYSNANNNWITATGQGDITFYLQNNTTPN